MELYTKTSYKLSRQLTLDYSTSFSKSTKLFPKDIQQAIFAIYGLVRIADEIVDTYKKADAAQLLNDLELETYRALKTHYSPNPIVHAFADTAAKYAISRDLIAPFFESMRMDTQPQTYTPKLYEIYIYGSAEVIGLMCLKVFCNTNDDEYKKLKPGAQALGAAYQKINFLRDIASDLEERGRVYFPGITFESFNDETKNEIIDDINKDLKKAEPALNALPQSARKAVRLSYEYYKALLNKIQATPASTLKASRIRISDIAKVKLLVVNTIRKTPNNATKKAQQ